MSFQWTRTPERATRELIEEYLETLRSAIYRLAQRFAPQIEAWMKANAVWTDRTGNARQTLQAEVERSMTEIAIVMFHGVDYGIYLELSYQGQYAIIGPALDYWSRRFWDAVKRLVES